MTITIETPKDIDEAIARGAAREGVTPEEYVLRAIIEKDARAAQSLQLNDAKQRAERARALFAKWESEDATDDPEEIARRQREGDEMIANIQANRFNIPRDPELVAMIEQMTEEDRRAATEDAEKGVTAT